MDGERSACSWELLRDIADKGGDLTVCCGNVFRAASPSSAGSSWRFASAGRGLSGVLALRAIAARVLMERVTPGTPERHK
jgi:hypothetical protein